jgi:D-alanyl-D-alanine carboxypeptidase/D-alanyl-D-alanine-endopeptidase (penicillin-binding protein 4)
MSIVTSHSSAAQRRQGVSTRVASVALAALTLLSSAIVLATPTQAQTRNLPPEIERAMRAASITRGSIAVVVQEVGQEVGQRTTRLRHNASSPMNPASLEKLISTQAALDLLGPAHVWRTPVWVDGPLRDQVLRGRVVIQGGGDPKFTVERLWLLLQRLRALGIQTIEGDIVIDQSAFDLPDVSPALFDNEPLRPYNVRPQAWLVNQKSLLFTFTPWPESNVAKLTVLPELQGFTPPASVPLLPGDCGDWRAKLAPQWGDMQAIRFDGGLPASCGEKVWPVAHADPANYHASVLTAMWRSLGGTLNGKVIESRSREMNGVPPTFVIESPPLAEVVRDINKYSNNTMAQQLFLTLSLKQDGVGRWERSREITRKWLNDIGVESLEGVLIDNGAGLSRDSRLTASLLAQVLQHAWRRGHMPELMASLPSLGVDGTLQRAKLAAGRAHLKTGSLRDVRAVAGYVLGQSGRRYVLVAIVNQDPAGAARETLEGLIQWTMDD